MKSSGRTFRTETYSTTKEDATAQTQKFEFIDPVLRITASPILLPVIPSTSAAHDKITIQNIQRIKSIKTGRFILLAEINNEIPTFPTKKKKHFKKQPSFSSHNILHKQKEN